METVNIGQLICCKWLYLFCYIWEDYPRTAGSVMLTERFCVVKVHVSVEEVGVAHTDVT